MRREHGSSGSQGDREDMERMAGSTGATGATSTGMHDTGSTTYEQQGYQQRGGTQPAGQYGQGREPARTADYGTSGYGRPTPSRPGAALAILAGALAFLQGLAFVIRAGYFHNATAGTVGYAYRWSLHGWGWTLLILGAILIAGGVSHLLGIKGSRQFSAAVAVITAVISFLVIFYSVVWSIVVVAACAFAAYSLLSDRGREESAGYGAGAYGGQGQAYGGEREEAMSQGKRSHRM